MLLRALFDRPSACAPEAPCPPCLLALPIYIEIIFPVIVVDSGARELGDRRCCSRVQVDRNLVLCLPRMAVLVNIEADRPGTWFPGPLAHITPGFPAFSLVGTLNESTGKPHENSVLFWRLLGGHIPKNSIFAFRKYRGSPHLRNSGKVARYLYLLRI
jgi:hypothetical protein